MHDLHRLGLMQATLDDSTFVQQYLGPQIIAQLGATPLSLSNWDNESIQLFRKICELMATKMPRADHVIRADVGTLGHAPNDLGALLMYFGIQLPLHGPRSQFLGLAARLDQGKVAFTFFIAGAANDAGRKTLARNEDPGKLVDEFTIRNSGDLHRFSVQALPQLERIDRAVAQLRLGDEGGFPPVHCVEGWGRDRRNREAANQLWNYWTHLQSMKPSADIAHMKQRLLENNGHRKQKIISLLEQYLPVDVAFSIGLSDAA